MAYVTAYVKVLCISARFIAHHICIPQSPQINKGNKGRLMAEQHPPHCHLQMFCLYFVYVFKITGTLTTQPPPPSLPLPGWGPNIFKFS